MECVFWRSNKSLILNTGIRSSLTGSSSGFSAGPASVGGNIGRPGINLKSGSSNNLFLIAL